MAEPYIAQIIAFGGNFAIRGWALCNGQLLSISQNTALFSILGTTYGGDGRTTFGLPDLRGRTPISSGRGPGLSDYRLGQRGGTETNSQVPAHTHPLAGGTATIKCNSSAAGEEDPTGNYLAATGEVTYSDESDSTMAANGVTLSGNTASHGTTGGVNNLQPYLAINWEIALVGQFPPRN